jgi:hypothetical protein
MQQIYNSDNRKFTLVLTVMCQGEGKGRFSVVAEDLKPNSRYVERQIEVEGKRTIELKFPVSPKKLALKVVSLDNIPFTTALSEKELVTYDIYEDEVAKSFIDFAEKFSMMCGYSEASDSGRLFTKQGTPFRIKYFNIIRDHNTGQVYNTPARIGHDTGIIEVSKAKFDKYTIPMRMIILLHEFSHKYRNPKIGLPISHETGADVNGLYLYLGNGFSKVDAICVFAKVFLKAQSDSNIERLHKIEEYISNFEHQKYTNRN